MKNEKIRAPGYLYKNEVSCFTEYSSSRFVIWFVPCFLMQRWVSQTKSTSFCVRSGWVLGLWEVTLMVPGKEMALLSPLWILQITRFWFLIHNQYMCVFVLFLQGLFLMWLSWLWLIIGIHLRFLFCSMNSEVGFFRSFFQVLMWVCIVFWLSSWSLNPWSKQWTKYVPCYIL